MTVRERFQKVMNFETPDRMPIMEWASWWDKTVDNWKEQGLVIPPVEGVGEGAALQKYFDMDVHLQYWVSFSTQATPEPAYHGAPLVESIDDYERILPTLYPENPLNVETLKTYAQWQQRGDAVMWMTLNGFFWGPRVLLGIEPHLYAFYDEPELMHRINEDILRFNLRVIDQMCQYITPDFMTFAEDMSYNNGPMIGEATFDQFMLPYYQRIVPELKKRGIRVIIDSDGDITKALPWFARAGIEGILPLERQAGVDLYKLREQFPKFLFMGHYDKMVMPHGEEAMRAEFERLLPLMKSGGFIPSVDHQTPPGVTLEQYRIYLKLFREYAAKACQ